MTIKHKLTCLLMAASSIAVLTTSLLFYHMVDKHFQETYHENLHDLAAIVGESCQAPLIFDVPDDAEKILRTLASRKSILRVNLFDSNNSLFASFVRNGQSRLDSKKFIRNAQGHSPGKAEEIIRVEDGTVGKIVIDDDMRDLTTSKRKIIGILSSVALGSLLISFFLSAFLQKIISTPINSLTEVVKQLAAGHYNITEPPCAKSHDEIGLLCAAFYQMSNNLKNSHEQLEENNKTLELKVTARTSELNNTLRDLTSSQAQLVQSEKMAALGLMVAGVAHEVNNNINFISSAIPTLSRKNEELTAIASKNWPPKSDLTSPQKMSQTITELLDNVGEGVRRTQKIVADLATFSKPSAGTSHNAKVNEELEKCISLLRYECRDRVKFTTKFDPNLPPISCIVDQINQVFLNIILNAIQAIEKKGQITITTWLEKDMIGISFTDNGLGVEKQNIAHIFDPFYTTKAPGKGTGLGLAISYSIIQKHDGTIGIHPNKGPGSTVTVLLPIIHQPENPPSLDRKHRGPR